MTELTKEEKEILISLISQLTFKVGELETAKKFEAITQKLKEGL